MAEFLGQGQSVGVGIMFQQRPDNVVIVKSLIPGGPAERSGNIRPGDLVQRVNGMDVMGRSLAALRGLIMGEPGTIVTLGVVRESSGSFIEVPLVRSSTGPVIPQHALPIQTEFVTTARPTVSPPIRAVTLIPDDADRLRHALRQSESVIKQHEDDLHNMRGMLERQRREYDSRVQSLEDQIRRMEADRHRSEQEKRGLEDNFRRLEGRCREVEEQNNELRSRHGMLSEEVNIALTKESMTQRMVEEFRARGEEEKIILEQVIARDQAEIALERNRRAEAEGVIAQLEGQIRRLQDEERIRVERDSHNRLRLEAERKRLDEVYRYAAEVNQILACVDPRLETIEREIFSPAALPIPPVPLTTYLATAAAAPMKTSSPAKPNDAYFIA